MSVLSPSPTPVLSEEVPGGAAWSLVLRRGEALRLSALADGANATLLLHAVERPVERLCLPDTLKAQMSAHVRAPMVLMSDAGRAMVSVTGSSLDWHDALTGYSTDAQVQATYGPSSYATDRNAWRQSTRTGVLDELAKHGLGERDLAAPVNLFSKVSVDADGRFAWVPDHAQAGDWVELRVELDVLVTLSTAPHPLDPRPEWAPVGARGAGAPGRAAGGGRPVAHVPPRVGARPRRDRAHRPERPVTAVEQRAALDVVVPAGDGWIDVVPAGSRLRIVDLDGNQAVDTLLYDAHDPANRYSAFDTVREQGGLYLTTGSVLMSTRLDPLATIVDDTVGRHDTVGGACAQESNVVRYGAHTRHLHSCRTTFVRKGRERGLEPRDLTANINFFMNVPVTPAGALSFEEGLSAPGKHVELRAERDHRRAHLRLPAAQQPLQRLGPDARPAAPVRRVTALVDAPAPSATTDLSVTVVSPGVQTSVQDLPGRTGLWSVGVPPSGAWDDLSASLANLAVGNAAGRGLPGGGPARPGAALRPPHPRLPHRRGRRRDARRPAAYARGGCSSCRPAACSTSARWTAPACAATSRWPAASTSRRRSAAARRSCSAASAATRGGRCGPATSWRCAATRTAPRRSTSTRCCRS